MLTEDKKPSILEIVDVLLAKGLMATIKGIGLFTIFILGLVGFIAMLISIVENGEWFSDLSRVEFFFLILMVFLIRRYRRYIKKNSQGFLVNVTRPFMLIGYANVVIVAICFAILVGMHMNGKPTEQTLTTMLMPEYWIDFVSMFLCAICLYLAAPVNNNAVLKDDGSSESSEGNESVDINLTVEG